MRTSPRISPLPAASGFALPSAIFLIVVLAALAAYIASVSVHQQSGHMADIKGVRAYQAARAGVEWGVFNLLRNNNCAAGSSFNPGGGLSDFTVTVDCLPSNTTTLSDEAGTMVMVRRIVATACNQPSAAGSCPNNTPGANYVERQIAVVAGQ